MKLISKQKKRMKIIYIDMDNVLVDFQSGIDSLTDEQRQAYKDNFDEAPGIFSKMLPIDGAIEAYKELNKHFDVYILSTALGTIHLLGLINYCGLRNILEH